MIMTQTGENSTPVGLDREAVVDEICGQAAAEFGLDRAQIGPDTVLKQLPGADSVQLLRVVAKVERRYDVEFDDEDVFAVRTPNELAALIVRLAANGQ
jgi:acyl carrier protein